MISLSDTGLKQCPKGQSGPRAGTMPKRHKPYRAGTMPIERGRPAGWNNAQRASPVIQADLQVTGASEKAICSIRDRLDNTIAEFTERLNDDISQNPFGKGNCDHPDVEADECDFAKKNLCPWEDDPHLACLQWEQWCAIIERGAPESLGMIRLPLPYSGLQ